MTTISAEQIMSYWPILMGVMHNKLPYADQAVWEDLAAATVEKALRNAHRYQDLNGSPHGWLTTMAARIALDYRKYQSYRDPQMLRQNAIATVDAGSDRHINHLDVHAAVAGLPEELAVLAAARLQDREQQEAARELGLHRSSAWRRERLMLAQLRMRLEAVSV